MKQTQWITIILAHVQCTSLDGFEIIRLSLKPLSTPPLANEWYAFSDDLVVRYMNAVHV